MRPCDEAQAPRPISNEAATRYIHSLIRAQAQQRNGGGRKGLVARAPSMRRWSARWRARCCSRSSALSPARRVAGCTWRAVHNDAAVCCRYDPALQCTGAGQACRADCCSCASVVVDARSRDVRVGHCDARWTTSDWRKEVMKRLIKCLAPLLVLVACGVESPDVIESTPSTQSVESSARVAPAESATTAPDEIGAPESLLDICAPSSPGICSNASVGESCGRPPLRCMPAQTLPDDSTWCLCQTDSTI